MAQALPTLLLLSFLAFVLGAVAGNPSSRIASAGLPPDVLPSPAQVNAVSHRLGFDQPLLLRYWRWLEMALRGDFGRSLLTHQRVLAAITGALPSTGELALVAVLFILLLAVPAGILGALLRRRTPYELLRVAEVSAASIPSFFLAYLLIYFFAVRIHWFPVTGQIGWRSIILPALTLAAVPTALIARLTETSLKEALAEEYIRAARSKGLGELRIVVRHALRNAATPVLAALGTVAVGLIEGSVTVEVIFGRSGIGRLTLQSVASADYPMIQGVVLTAGLLVILFNLGADLLVPIVDPRVRLGARS